jgi:hypothetical protein
MISHMVHFVYEAVEHVAEEAEHQRPGPDEGVGTLVVWAAAIAGGFWAGSKALALYAATSPLGMTGNSNAFTEEHAPGLIALTGAGAIVGAVAGLAIWWLLALALTRSEV